MEYQCKRSEVLEPLYDISLNEERHMVVLDAALNRHITTILDLGCSEGHFLQRASRCASLELLVGVDIDKDAIR